MKKTVKSTKAAAKKPAAKVAKTQPAPKAAKASHATPAKIPLKAKNPAPQKSAKAPAKPAPKASAKAPVSQAKVKAKAKGASVAKAPVKAAKSGAKSAPAPKATPVKSAKSVKAGKAAQPVKSAKATKSAKAVEVSPPAKVVKAPKASKPAKPVETKAEAKARKLAEAAEAKTAKVEAKKAEREAKAAAKKAAAAAAKEAKAAAKRAEAAPGLTKPNIPASQMPYGPSRFVPPPPPEVFQLVPVEQLMSTRTPRQAHFRMPAEWERHLGTWLSWPDPNGVSFPGKTELDEILQTFYTIVRSLVTTEYVYINGATEADRNSINDQLTVAEQTRVIFCDTPSVEPWCRDHGCTFLIKDEDKAPGAVIWKFNGWGAKYGESEVDAAIAAQMAMKLQCKIFDPGIVMEGGAIDVNGTGSVFVTESCLLNKNRNKGLKKEAIEQILRDYLNVTNILWLTGGALEGDDTDGHIDTITRFCSKNVVVTMVEEDENDPNYVPLQQNLELLEEMVDEDGNPLEIIEIPMPKAISRKGQRLPATYANFYVFNGGVLLPTFEDPADEKALEMMVKAFPGRRVYPIDSRELLWGLGSFHCLTQQIPLAKYPPIMAALKAPPSPQPVRNKIE
jgi:agmatine deiminase